MKYLERSIMLILALLMLSCGTDSEPEDITGTWLELGLTSSNVTTLDFNEGIIFVASKTQLYKNNIHSASDEWLDISFQFNTENSELGDILFTDSGLYAVVRNTTDYHDLPKDYTSLYKSIDLGKNWAPIQITLEGLEKPYVINRLAKTTSPLYADCSIIFKSIDEGKTWTNLIPNNRVGVSEFLYVSKDHPNQIWTGGWTNIFTPYLAKSEDAGETWTTLNDNIYFNAEASAYAAAVHPQDIKQVIVALGGGIVKSTDNGKTWSTASVEGAGVFTLTHGTRNPKIVYATGLNAQGTLFFATTGDFGDTWETVEFEGGPTHIQVNDMISVLQDGKEVLYFGTNKGVYSYTFEK